MKKILLLLTFILATVLGFKFIEIFLKPRVQDAEILEFEVKRPTSQSDQSAADGALPEKPPDGIGGAIKNVKPAAAPNMAKIKVSPGAEESVQIALPPPSSKPRLSDQEIYSNFSAAIIQILCSTQGELFSASGLIVNQNGLVLTNAHVAEIVGKIGEGNCRARHGNPASPFAKVSVVFVPDTAPRLPGNSRIYQRDFAFLKITEPKESFGSAELGLGVVDKNETLLTLGYPSEFLESVNTSLNSNLVFSALNVDGYADLDGDLSSAEGYVFNGGLILQQGSSGTALFSRAGETVGIIFATTKEKTTAERQGIALMTSYIDRILKLETGQGLLDFIKIK